MVALNLSLPPARTCPDPSALTPGCSYCSVLQDALCPAPSCITRAFVEASLPPVRTCPDPSALTPGCSCLSVCQDALCPVPSRFCTPAPTVSVARRQCA